MRQFLAMLKTNIKLVVMHCVVLLITLVLGINAIVNLNSFDRDAQTLYEKDLLGISHVKEANNIPVLFVTGTADDYDVLKAKSLGAVGFIMKPIEGDVVLIAVKNAIEALASSQR